MLIVTPVDDGLGINGVRSPIHAYCPLVTTLQNARRKWPVMSYRYVWRQYICCKQKEVIPAAMTNTICY